MSRKGKVMDRYLANILKRQRCLTEEKSSLGPGRQRCISAFGVVRALGLSAVLVFLSGCSNDEFIQKLASVEARLERLEARLTQIEGSMEKMGQLERQVVNLEKSLSELKKPANPIPETIRYHPVRQGDTLSGIAQEYGMTVQELCRLNEITPSTVIRPGEMLLVKPGS